jgi:hypothetical protein
MLSERELSAAIGSTAYGPNGDKIGTVESFFLDDRTGTPTWVAVSTGLFGSRHSIAPAADAAYDDGGLRLPVTADAVKAAPHMAGDHLDPAEESALRAHYGIAHPAPAVPPRSSELGAEDAVPAAPEVDGRLGDGGMTRSEEQLRVGTERRPATRVRLVKYVITEDVQITVPIRREEIRIEEVPLDAPDPGPGESLVAGEFASGGAPSVTPSSGMGGLPEEIVLHTERPVVTVEVVPSERVRLRTELVEGQETVTGQVQREQIVVEQTPGPRTGR